MLEKLKNTTDSAVFVSLLFLFICIPLYFLVLTSEEEKTGGLFSTVKFGSQDCIPI